MIKKNLSFHSEDQGLHLYKFFTGLIDTGPLVLCMPHGNTIIVMKLHPINPLGILNQTK